MSQDFFRIERGLELDEQTQILQGSGLPGLAGDTTLAKVGSVYQQNDTGDFWTKISAGAGNQRWQKMASESYVNNAVGSTVSWREPAVVRNNVATVLPTGTATSPIVIDGVSITDGQRVLFTAISGGDGKNVYIYQQSSGLFIEDTNTESTGDAVYVQSGTSAGKTFVFNSTDWVLTDQASLDEEGFIRAFIGKNSSGNDMPDYTSNNFVTDASSLETAISALDSELGSNVSLGNFVAPANKINQNIQALDAEIGANVTVGNHIAPANKINQNIQALDTQVGAELVVGNFIAANQSTNSAITALDAEIGANVVSGNFVSGSNKINTNIQALDTQLGANVINGGQILSTNSTNANLQALDTALSLTTTATTVNNVSSIQTIDTVIGRSAKWLVHVVDSATGTKAYSTEVYAMTDGLTADFTRYGTLKLGTTIAGLVVSVDLDAGTLRLRVASTGAVDVSARRVGVVV